MSSREIDLVRLRQQYGLGANPPENYALYAPRSNARFAQRLINAKQEQAKEYFTCVDAYVTAANTYADLLKKEDEQQESQQLTDQRDQLSQALGEMCTAYTKLSISDANSIDIPRATNEGMQIVFEMCALFLAATFIVTPNLAMVIAEQAVACGWNLFDGSAGAANVYYSEERNNSHDKFWDKAQSVSAAQLLLATTINTTYLIFELLAKTGIGLASTVISNLPAALGVLNGPSFALCMLVSALQSYDDECEAKLKSLDVEYFEKSCREAIKNEYKNLLPGQTWLQRLTGKMPSQEQFNKAHERIQQLEKDAEALQCYQKSAEKKLPANDEERQKIIYAKLLMDRQAEKAEEHRMNGHIWSAATVVMIAACLPMPAMVAGAVMFGILGVGAVKLGQALGSRIGEDYSEEAVKVSSRSEEELLTDALKAKVTAITTESPHVDVDVVAIKKYLSKEHRQELINAEARKDYSVRLYLGRKAENAKQKVSNLGKSVYSFFSKALESPFNKEPELSVEHAARGYILVNSVPN